MLSVRSSSWSDAVKTSYSLGLMIFLVTASASADIGAASDEALHMTANAAPPIGKWYVQAGAQYVTSDVTAAKLAAALEGSASFIQVRKLDESSAGWSLNLGYRFKPGLAIELGVMDLGQYESVVDVRNADEAAVRRIIASRHPVSGAGVRLAGVGRFTRGPLMFSATLGGFQSMDADIRVLIDGTPVTVQGERFSVLLDAAVGYQLPGQWSVELATSYLDLNQTVLASGLRLTLGF
jgi:hypothetical protein